MSSPVRRGVWFLWRLASASAARAYIAGPRLENALEVCSQLARNGFTTSVGYWDEESEDAGHVADVYVAALDVSNREGISSLSIKFPSLEFSHDHLARVLTVAAKHGIHVRFDSLAHDTVDRTLHAIDAVPSAAHDIGLALPGRWRRSIADADWAVQRRLVVRVVKGQWVDPEYPELDPRSGFLRVVERLAGRARHVAVATHDAPLAREALRLLKAAGTSCELELLFGLPTAHVIGLARSLDVQVRFYVPYGYAWLPYCLSQARRNPKIFWWIAKDLARGVAERGLRLQPR